MKTSCRIAVVLLIDVGWQAVNCESPFNFPIVTIFEFQRIETCCKTQSPDSLRGEAGSFPCSSPTFASFLTEISEFGCVQAVSDVSRRPDWPRNTHVFGVPAEDQVVAFVLLQGKFEPDVRKEGVTVDPLEKENENASESVMDRRSQIVPPVLAFHG
jgi:hypothetical protein